MIATAARRRWIAPPVIRAALAIVPRPDPATRVIDLIDRAHAEIGARLAAQLAALERLEARQ